MARTPLAAYRVLEAGGLVVARVECKSDKDARREIDHYAAQYAQDGPVVVQRRVDKRWEAVYSCARREHVGLAREVR